MSVINTATNTIAIGGPAGGVAVSPDGAHVYVANTTIPGGTVSVIAFT
jgi:DNA-binding beta-propeller fold protein YncE